MTVLLLILIIALYLDINRIDEKRRDLEYRLTKMEKKFGVYKGEL